MTKTKMQWVRIADAASEIGLSARQLRELVRTGKVKARQKGLGKTSPYYLSATEIQRVKRAYQLG